MTARSEPTQGGSGGAPPAHRLTAVLSADAVGYSRLMSLDEAGAIRSIHAHREAAGALIAEHGGRVVDAPGDNLLAELPSVLEAVRCALAIQEASWARNQALPESARMPLRIGIHFGDVAVEGGSIYGHGVNIAARLESLAEPGGICISEAVHDQVKHRMALAIEDLGAKQLKNIPEPVRVLRIVVGRPARKRAPRLTKHAALACVALAALALAFWVARPLLLAWVFAGAGVSRPPENPPLPDRPSLVVLPFVNLSDDPAQRYFSDGVTEELTNTLARSGEVFVISRNSAFTYKDRSVPVAQIGRELGVRYVVEGSVRRADDRVRITAQLIDATRDFHLWSETYDRELRDIFALQSEIAREIFLALNYPIMESEIARIARKPTADFSAYEAYMQGVHLVDRMTRDDNRQARVLLERALALDPEFADAWGALGGTYALEYGQGWSVDPANLEKAEEMARRALAIDPRQGISVITLTAVHLFRNEGKEALETAERSVELAPQVDSAHALHAAALAENGHFLDALEAMKQALRLNPRAPSWSWAIMALVSWGAGREEEGLALLERARGSNPDLIMARAPLVLIYEGEGRHEEAQAVSREIRAINPDFTAEHALRFVPLDLLPSNMDRQEALGLLRAGGLP